MTLRQLELFLALAQNPHLNQVAQDNNLTQSAVSMAIKALEETLEKKLFDRINKKLILNENGRFFYRMVEPLVFGLNESKTLFKGQDLKGDLKVGASSSIANYILPQIMFDFMEEYAGVTIQKVTANTKEIVSLCEKGEVDIGFVEGEYTVEDIRRDPLGTDELYIVTGDEELAKQSEYRVEELFSRKWSLREKGSGTRDVFLNHLGKLQKRLTVFQEQDTTESVKAVLDHPDTVCCISRVAVERELASGQLFRLMVKDFEFQRSFYTIWHKNKHFSSLLQEFIYFTKEEYRTKYN